MPAASCHLHGLSSQAGKLLNLSSDFSYYYLSLRLLFEYYFFKEVFSTSQFSHFSSLWLPYSAKHLFLEITLPQCKFTSTFWNFVLISALYKTISFLNFRNNDLCFSHSYAHHILHRSQHS